MTERRHRNLLEVVAAVRSPARFPGRLHGRDQQSREDGDDRHHGEQLDEREATGSSQMARPAGPFVRTLRRQYD